MVGNVHPSVPRKQVLCLPNISIYEPTRTTERSPTLTEPENEFIFIVWFFKTVATSKNTRGKV